MVNLSKNEEVLVSDRYKVYLDGDSVDQAIDYLKGFKEKYGEGFLSFEREEYSTSMALFYIVQRPENNKEKNKRLELEEKRKRWRLEQYKNLKKEFGDE